MRLGVLSDLHLQERSNFRQRIASLNQAKSILAEQDVDSIIILGDIAGRDAPHRLTINERLSFAKFFSELSNIAPTYLLRGNHDHPRDISVFQYCNGKYPIYTIIDEVRSFENQDVNLIFAPFTQVPSWGNDLLKMESEVAQTLATERLKNEIAKFIDPLKKNILFGHYLIQGSICGSFEIESVKDILLTEKFFTELPLNAAYFGHIHERQEFDFGYPVSYVGALYQTDFGEKINNRGLTILDINHSDTITNSLIKLNDDFKLYTIYCKWENNKISMSIEDQKMISTRASCDNTRFKFKLDLPEHISHYTVPFQTIQLIILGNGGHFDLNDVELVKKNISNIQITKSTLSTPQESIINRIKKTFKDDNEKYLSRFEDLSPLWISTK